MPHADIAFATAVELAARIRRRELSPVEVVNASISQIEKLNPVINAVTATDFGGALAAARTAEAAVISGHPLGPLHGLPVGIKDLTETKGLRTTYGSRLFEHHVPDVDAIVVERIKAAGGIVIGKTNTPEFGAGANTTNPVFGTTLNPWDLSKSSGGSSGGSAAGLAAGMFPLAEGSDHGGSLRMPAAICGVVGFRVSPGRVPSWPHGWLFDLYATHGPMARTVKDAALLLSVLAGPDDRNPLSISDPGEPFASAAEGDVRGWRLAFSPTLGGLFPVERDVAAVVERAARRFADLGCVVEDADPDLHDAAEIIPGTRALRTGIANQEQLSQLDRVANDWMKEFAEKARRMSLLDASTSEWKRSRLWERTRAFFQNRKLLLLPTMPVAAFGKDEPHATAVDGRPFEDHVQAVLSTYAITMTGLPAISIPAGFTPAGLPVGLQIVGGWRREADVLRAAAAFEAAFPWSNRRPAIADAR
ncbi:MAG: amidase family protein [Chloroflexota bacterium]